MTQAAPPKVPFFCGAAFQCPKTPIAKEKSAGNECFVGLSMM